MDSEAVTPEALSTWCQVHLGSGVDALLFDAGFTTHVQGLQLSDGREVVVKLRQYMPRLHGAAAVQAAFGCDVRFTPGPADRITRIVLDGTRGPVGDVFGVRYERAD